MTTEEEDIRQRLAEGKTISIDAIQGLLELVASYRNMIIELNQEITHYCDVAEKLQERVRELEADIAQCRDKYDGNHD